MKLQTGDLLITTGGSTVLIIDVEESGMVKGFHGNKTVIQCIGYDRYIIQHLNCGNWKHFPVLK